MNAPDSMDRAELFRILAAVHDQVATALWLSAGMVLAVASVACAALRWNRACLVLGFLYCASLCFVHNGHAQALGPAGCAFALAGLAWPARKSRPPG